MVTTAEESAEDDLWYMDTGCSNHMTNNKDWLINFDPSKKNRIRLVDERTMSAEGMGDIMVVREDGKTMVIENVWYVPGMKCNLMSVGQLLEIGFSVSMCDGKMELFDQ